MSWLLARVFYRFLQVSMVGAVGSWGLEAGRAC